MATCTFHIEGALSQTHVAGTRAFRSGMVFRIDDYPDKGVTKEHLLATLPDAVKRFKPVPINVEHIPTIFDGKLGEMVSVSLDPATGLLDGNTSLPLPVQELLGDGPIGVSIELDSDTSDILGLAFTGNPRVKDAAVFNKFSMSMGVDTPKKEKKMAIKGTLESIKNLFSQGIAELEKIEEPVSGQTPTVTVQPTVTSPVTVSNEAALAEERAKREKAEKELEELKKANEDQAARMESNRLQTEAEKWSESVILDRRALPSQKDWLVNMFCMAARQDNQGKTCFSDTGAIIEGDALKQLKAGIASAPQHKWTEEYTKGLTTIQGTHTKTSMSIDKRAELLSLTPMGRQTNSFKKSQGEQ